jgi:hypothetical protein
VVLPIIVEQYPFYAPMIFALYTLGSKVCRIKVGTAVGTVAVGTGIRMKNRLQPPDLGRRAA